MHICVCICTYKRPRLLAKLLRALEGQETGGRFTYAVVVADNDADRSAEPVVREFTPTYPVTITYCCEPVQNIALARNRALAHAQGDYIALIDDDEFPAAGWLTHAFTACARYDAAGVLAPVRPFFEGEPPRWLVQGRFCERPEHPTGHVLDWRETRSGNVLFRRDMLDGVDEPFCRTFGNGGEDQEFFRRFIARGNVFVWCNEAAVHEVVPPERWTRRYLLKRAWLRGQNERHLTDAASVVKSLMAVPLYAMLAPFALLAGQLRSMDYLIRLCDHAGKLCAMVGFTPLGDTYFEARSQP